MFDRRVVRGNTYSKNQEPVARQSKSKRRSSGQKVDTRVRPNTPPAVGGRSHMTVQTETYLEELTDKVPEVDEGTQTDAYMDRPAAPMFIPQNTGLDAGTQIEDGDLFDFDFEVEPILEVLVGKTLEMGMMEVLEEEELNEIRQHQENFEQARNAELAEVQRLEAEARRKNDEKRRRIAEEKVRMVAKAEMEEKVAARSFAKHYLADLHSNVFEDLMDAGHFYDPRHREVADQFMPFLMQNACAQVEQITLARNLTSMLIAEVVRTPP